jgi:hypothetical protein
VEEWSEGVGVVFEETGAATLDQFDISLFLTGDDFDDEAGAAGGGGFVGGGAPGFGDDEVVGGHEVGHVGGPAEPGDVAVGKFGGEEAGGRGEAAGVATEDEREGEVWRAVAEQRAERAGKGTSVAGSEEKGGAWRIVSREDGQAGEDRGDREAGIDYGGVGAGPLPEPFGGDFVGGEVGADRVTAPDRVNGDGVGDHGVDRQVGAPEQAVEQGRVEWERADDGGGWVAAQVMGERLADRLQGVERVVFEWQATGVAVELAPRPGGVGDGGGVGVFEEASDDRLGFADEVADVDAHGGAGELADGVGEAAGGAVVTVTE